MTDKNNLTKTPTRAPAQAPAPTDKIRFAIIGCGHIGLRHAECIIANPQCRLTAFCDTRPAEELGFGILPSPSGDLLSPFEYLAQWNGNAIPFFRDEDGLLTKDFDVLCIATPNGLHETHALKALKNGRHVLIEKPMALTAAACSNIIREAARRDRQVFCVMQNRYSPPSAWLKGLLEKKALGRIFLVTVNCFWNRDDRYYRKDGWRGTLDLDGGTLFTQFSHFVDSLLWLFGDIGDIQARFGNFSHGRSISIEDTGTVSFAFTQGGMGCLNFTTSVRQQNLESSMTVIAEKGTVRISGQYMEKVDVCSLADPAGDPAGFLLPPSANPARANHARANHACIYDNIVSVLKNDGLPDIDPREAGKVVETIERIYSRKKPI